jgi:hypothetical protein
MGIFAVNMALLYGEGSRAFARLQEEIIRHTQDTSFLFWGYADSTHMENRLLAESPRHFQGLGAAGISRAVDRQFLAITNVGLEIEARVCRMGQDLYGLVTGGRDSRLCYMVLVRKLTLAKTFIKLGVAARDPRPPCWFETRKIVVEWGADERTDSGAPLLFAKEPLILGLTVNASKESDIRVLKILRTSRRELHDHIPPLYGDTHIIEFDDPTDIEFAKLVCQISQTSVLAIYLSYDFDCCPCALVCNERDEPSVPAVYSYFRKAHLQSPSVEEQYNIMTSTKRNFGCDAYCFRNLSRETISVKVPAELIGEGHTVWISFVPPPSRAYTPYGLLTGWKFYISDSLALTA